MFNIGPMEFVVLALVGIVILGPDRLPQFARDAARMIRTLRDMATGAQRQLREELGPEFADLDLRNLNPRTAVQRAVFGDEMPDIGKFSPGNFVRDSIFGDDDAETDDADADDSVKPVSMDKPSANGSSGRRGSANGTSANRTSANRTSANRTSANGTSANGAASANGAERPRPRPRPRTSYDEDAT